MLNCLGRFYFRVVKSVSRAGLKPPSAAFSQVHASAGLEPQAQVAPQTDAFSVDARSHVHWPAGLARHEQRGPCTVFSDDALPQLHWRADCLPQEQVAFCAQMHSAPSLVQQVEALVMAMMKNAGMEEIGRAHV